MQNHLDELHCLLGELAGMVDRLGLSHRELENLLRIRHGFFNCV